MELFEGSIVSFEWKELMVSPQGSWTLGEMLSTESLRFWIQAWHQFSSPFRS